MVRVPEARCIVAMSPKINSGRDGRESTREAARRAWSDAVSIVLRIPTDMMAPLQLSQ